MKWCHGQLDARESAPRRNLALTETVALHLRFPKASGVDPHLSGSRSHSPLQAKNLANVLDKLIAAGDVDSAKPSDDFESAMNQPRGDGLWSTRPGPSDEAR